jgi:hypothetical protein
VALQWCYVYGKAPARDTRLEHFDRKAWDWVQQERLAIGFQIADLRTVHFFDCTGQDLSYRGTSIYEWNRQACVRASCYPQHGDGVGILVIPRKGVLAFVTGLDGPG